jgi:hypothetical protein
MTYSAEATLEVLHDVADWRLPAAGWARVAEIVEVIEAAALSGDAAAVAAATVNLELTSPVRITRIGSTEAKVPVPPRIRERVNRLAHRLGEPSVPTGAAGREGSGHDRPLDPR